MTDDDNLDEIPLDIMRLAQDVSRSWRHCRRKTCKRGRACRGRDVLCAREQPRNKTPRDPEKAARDDARAMAIFQRMLQRKIDEDERGQAPAGPRPHSKARTRRAD